MTEQRRISLEELEAQTRVGQDRQVVLHGDGATPHPAGPVWVGVDDDAAGDGD